MKCIENQAKGKLEHYLLVRITSVKKIDNVNSRNVNSTRILYITPREGDSPKITHYAGPNYVVPPPTHCLPACE